MRTSALLAAIASLATVVAAAPASAQNVNSAVGAQASTLLRQPLPSSAGALRQPGGGGRSFGGRGGFGGGPRGGFAGGQGRGGFGGGQERGFAGGGDYRGGRDGYRRHGYGVGAGLANLAAGAVIGGAIASQPYGYGYGYDTGYDADYDAGQVYTAPIPAGGDDEGYCAQRYKSYDPASGTYLGYDGLRHPCP